MGTKSLENEGVQKSAVTPSSADLLALKFIVMSLIVRMANANERVNGTPMREFPGELAEDCERLLKSFDFGSFPARDVQKLREDITSAIGEFLKSSLTNMVPGARTIKDQ